MTERRIEPGDEFARLFATIRRSAWRWECQKTYRGAGEASAIQLWKSGQPDALTWLAPWLHLITEAVAAGKTFARVRVYSEPPTEYLRWQSAVTTPRNIEAGEDIRVLTEDQARQLGLPDWDFWLFDETEVLLLHFGDGNALTDATLTDDRDTVSRCRAARDLAVRHSLPFGDYAALRSM